MSDKPNYKKLAGQIAGAVSFFAVLTLVGGFRWPWALCFMGAMAVHENGHAYAARRCGVKPGIMTFFPLGMFVSLPGVKTADMAFVALAGPLAGMLASFACAAAFFLTGKPELAALAAFIAIVNLFNLFPLNPLDGGRIVHSVISSVSARAAVWFAGICLAAAAWFSITVGPVYAVLLLIGLPEFLVSIRKLRDDKIKTAVISRLSALYGVPAEPRAVIEARLQNWRLSHSEIPWQDLAEATELAKTHRRVQEAEFVWEEYAAKVYPKDPRITGRELLVKILRTKSEPAMSKLSAARWLFAYTLTSLFIFAYTGFIGSQASPDLLDAFKLLQ